MSFFWYVPIVAIVGLVLLAGQGCRSGPYETFTLKKGVGHYTFEYPSGYTIDIVEVRDDLAYSNIDLSSTKYGWFVSMGVLVATDTGEPPTPSELLERDISRVRGDPDFQLLERSTVVIAGMEAEQATYSYQQIQRPVPDKPTTYVPVVQRHIYFSQAGRLWFLSAQVPQAVSDVGMVDFEHVVQTFKILE